MAKLEVERIMGFEALLHSFALVERVAHIKGRVARENDVEHSFHIAMLAWYILDAFKLPLDVNRVIQYALVHDLVEVYAGDTYIWDEEAKKTKHEREEKARLQIADEFPEFPSLNVAIEKYEKQEDAESKFVKALDKVQPVMANYLENGRTWKEMEVAFADLVAHKRERVANVEEIRDLLEDIIAIIEPKKRDYFVK